MSMRSVEQPFYVAFCKLLDATGDAVTLTAGECREIVAFAERQSARIKELEGERDTFRKAYDYVDGVLNVVKEERDRLRAKGGE